jgi:hypothetical protein
MSKSLMVLGIAMLAFAVFLAVSSGDVVLAQAARAAAPGRAGGPALLLAAVPAAIGAASIFGARFLRRK